MGLSMLNIVEHCFETTKTLLNDANFTVLHSGNIPEVQGNGMIGENPLNFRFGSDTNGNGNLTWKLKMPVGYSVFWI